MQEYDFDGDMSIFQEELLRHGITPEIFDITNFCGLTYRELKSTVQWAIAVYGRKPDV